MKQITENQFKAISMLQKLLKDNFCLTGSITLVDILDREIGDIDIVVNDWDVLVPLNEKKISIYDSIGYEEKGKNNMPKITRKHFVINDVSICVFEKSLMLVDIQPLVIRDKAFLSTKPKLSLDAKKEHINNLLKSDLSKKSTHTHLIKHINDLCNYFHFQHPEYKLLKISSK